MAAKKELSARARSMRINKAVKAYKGKRMKDGRPDLRELRRQADLDDLTSDERNEAFEKSENAKIKKAPAKAKAKVAEKKAKKVSIARKSSAKKADKPEKKSSRRSSRRAKSR